MLLYNGTWNYLKQPKPKCPIMNWSGHWDLYPSPTCSRCVALTKSCWEMLLNCHHKNVTTKLLTFWVKARKAQDFKVGVKKYQSTLKFALCMQIFTIFTVFRECRNGSLASGAVVPATYNCFSFPLFCAFDWDSCLENADFGCPAFLGSGTSYSSIYVSRIFPILHSLLTPSVTADPNKYLIL